MKHTVKFFPVLFISVLGICFFTSCKKTANWSRFRGDNNMTAEGKNLSDQWSIDTNVAWTYDIEGEGWSSPVIWGDRAFILSVVPESVSERPEEPRPQPPAGGQNPPPNGQGNPQSGGPQPAQGGSAGQSRSGQGQPPIKQDEDTLYRQDIYRWEVICIDMNTGREIWKQVALKGHPRINKHRMSNYASETPVTDGQRIYAWFGMHGLYCYDMDGKLLWQKDLGKYNTLNDWGTGSSPVLHNNTLFIQMDNEEHSFITALDASTGNEKWRMARDEKTNYSTPVIWQNKKRTELVVGGKTAHGYDPVTGKILWQLNLGGDMNIPSAAFDNERIYMGNEGRRVKGKFFAINAGAEGDITPEEGDSTSTGVAWSVSDAGQGSPSPLLYKGYIYIISGRGGKFTCIQAADGKQVYKETIEGIGAVWSSPWAYNNKVFFNDETGKTFVIQAGTQYALLGTNKLDDKFWASVAIAGDALLFRGADKLYCVKK